MSWNLEVENCELRVYHICELKNMIFTGEYGDFYPFLKSGLGLNICFMKI